MSNYLDHKYINLISARLPKFKWKRFNPNLANFRCIFCNDSEKKKNKCRGYLIEKPEGYQFYCHNCSASHRFSYFLKLIAPEIFKEYLFEKFKDNEHDSDKKVYYDNNPNNEFKKPAFIADTQLRTIKKISSLPATHSFKVYIVKRLIPNTYHCRLFYCPNFFAWVNTIIPEKFNILGKDQERLIIPFLDKDLKLFGFQGRTIELNVEPRYYTIMLDANFPKVFGLDTTDFKKPNILVEGPLDSIFIKNAFAMVGGDFTFGKGCELSKELTTICLDNEPRSKQTIKKMEHWIDQGYKICIWPSNIKQKDINEMVIAGMKPLDIRDIIDYNTCSGLSARLKLNEWKKI